MYCRGAPLRPWFRLEVEGERRKNAVKMARVSTACDWQINDIIMSVNYGKVTGGHRSLNPKL